MNNNGKLLLYGSASAIVLVVVIAIFLVRLLSPTEKKVDEDAVGVELLCRAIPSDAVLLFDIKEVGNLTPLLEDTLSFAYKLFDRNHIIGRFQKEFVQMKGESDVPVLFSLHYSAKNDVSLLFVMDIGNLLLSGSRDDVMGQFLQKRAKVYNNTNIYKYGDSLYLACYDNLVIASCSLYVLESSIRHLDNNTSVLDNSEFKKQLGENGSRKCLYVNHHQIGKFFSGVMSYGFLKYSDFFLRYASWSALEIGVTEGELKLSGKISNNKEEKYNSSVLYSQLPVKSSMGKILPAQTVYALGLSLMDMQGYFDANNLFLEVHKKLRGYNEDISNVRIEGMASPIDYLRDSLNVEELVAAYCKFGDMYEWITFVREKSSFEISEVVGNVIIGKKEIPVEPYLYKGYIASVFGEAFSHCNEECYCKIGNWTVIGSKEAVSDYASGNANYTNLDYYLKQTPAKEFLNKEGIVKVIANLQEGKEKILPVVKPYYSALVNKSLEVKNFEFLALNVTNSGEDIIADASLYAVDMKQLPLPKPREELVRQTYIDSTIVIDNSLFELKDFVKGGKCYLEQIPNNKLRMLDGKKKGLWTIPFETPLCGAVKQIDFFDNNKLQMLFISADRLYLLDRVGRFVNGFPLTLPKRVVYGPELVDIKGDGRYSFMVLNEDNSITVYNLDGRVIKELLTIKSEDFVKELPVLECINGKEYLVLRTVQRMRFYKLDGEEVVVNDKKRAIAPDSGFEVVAGNEIKVMGVDGKEFIVDLVTGKTRKCK